MKDWKEFFKGKRVTQLGLGLLGRGVRDADFLARHCKEVIVTDKKTTEVLAGSVDRLSQHSNIVFHLGGHSLEDFKDRDFILKGSGVPIASEEIACAKAEGIPVYMDESLFFELMPECTFVAVTGTRGKTTTTMLLHHIVSHAMAGSKNVFLAGNIQEVATLPMLEEVKDGDIIIAEMSSWQLQGFGDIRKSPHISVFTNFLPDHLNYYGDMQSYFDDKAFIFSNQTESDTLICTKQSIEQIKKLRAGAPNGAIVVADPSDMNEIVSQSLLIGEHNKQNVACAVSAARLLGISDDEIISALKTFTGAPGRLEKVGEFSGVTVYNDTTSTTPDALGVALDSFAPNKNIILITGGADKGLDFSNVIQKIASIPKHVIMTPGNGTVRIEPEVKAACAEQGTTFTVSASTADAVALAKEVAKEGDIVIFSPAFASFSEFKNEYDRGESYLRFVKDTFQ